MMTPTLFYKRDLICLFFIQKKVSMGFDCLSEKDKIFTNGKTMFEAVALSWVNKALALD